MAFSLLSPAFPDGGRIPAIYTGDGDNCSPPLAWSDPPAGTLSFALTLIDIDEPAGLTHHWTLFDIPAGTATLPEGFPGDAPLGSMRELENGFGHLGYGGPLPPHGHGPHRYEFTLYALSTERLDAGPSRRTGPDLTAADIAAAETSAIDIPTDEAGSPAALIAQLEPLTLATATLIGFYER